VLRLLEEWHQSYFGPHADEQKQKQLKHKRQIDYGEIHFKARFFRSARKLMRPRALMMVRGYLNSKLRFPVPVWQLPFRAMHKTPRMVGAWPAEYRSE
jgi:hypothetical protein